MLVEQRVFNSDKGFSETSAKGRIVKNTIFLTVASFGGRFVSYITFVLLARFFTPTEVGVWAVLLTAYLMAEVISNLGLDKIVIRNLAQNTENAESFLASTLVLKIGTSVVVGLAASLIVLVSYSEISGSYPVASVLFFLAVPIVGVTRTIEAWHTAREQMAVVAVAQILERIVLFALLGCFILTEASFGYFIAASALAPIVRFLVVLRPAWPHVYLKWPQNLRPLLAESLVLFGVELIAGIYMRLDLILISKLGSLEEVALYNASYRVFEFFTVVFGGFLVAIFPSVARRANLSVFKNTFLIGCVIVVVAAILGIALREPIMGLFGPSYLEAANTLLILMLALPLSYVTSFMVNYLVASKHTRLVFVLAVVTVGSNLLFNFMLIPKYSIWGAAVAFLLSEIVSCIILFFVAKFILKEEITIISSQKS